MNELVIVTGGAGFIGSNLCKKLLELNYFVVSIDNYFTGSKENHHKSNNIVYLEDTAKNINNNSTLALLQLNKDIKYIFHLGEYSRVEQSFDDFNLVCEYNNALPEICEFARKHKAKIIYSGSSTKFAAEGIISPYALTKAQNTEFIKYYADWYEIEYAIAYFYNVYGPSERSTGKYSTVIAKFLELAKQNKCIPVTSPGTQLRNFTHIDDIISGLILIAEKGYGDEFGIGHDEAWSILDVARMIGNKIEMRPRKRGNRMSASVCNSKLKLLGWEAKNNLKMYLQSQLF